MFSVLLPSDGLHRTGQFLENILATQMSDCRKTLWYRKKNKEGLFQSIGLVRIGELMRKSRLKW